MLAAAVEAEQVKTITARTSLPHWLPVSMTWFPVRMWPGST